MQNNVEIAIKQILRNCDDREGRRRWREWAMRAASALFCLILFEVGEHYALAYSLRGQAYNPANDRPIDVPLSDKKLVEGCNSVGHLVGRECNTQGIGFLANRP